MSKKILSGLVGALAVLTTPFIALAQWNAPTVGGGTISVQSIMTSILTPMWQLFVGIAIIMFIVAGILFLTSNGEPGKVTSARQAVIWGVIGIVVAVIAFSIVTIVRGWVGG